MSDIDSKGNHTLSARVWLRQFGAPVVLVAALAVLLSTEIVTTAFDAPVRLVLEAVALACGIAWLVRATRRTYFSLELSSLLRRLQAGEKMGPVHFKRAISTEDRGVALAFMEAAKGVHRRFQTILQDRVSEEAIISSMAEGVVVFDRRERIVRMNAAAAMLLGVIASDIISRPMSETIPSQQFQNFVKALLQGEEPADQDLQLRGGADRDLQMTGRELRDMEGNPVGGIVVLSDVTRLRSLERTRSDFIANVSHELKTPVTSIRGFAETLLDGALDNPEDARRFIGIISRQADRLSQIFDDMMALSRLEQEDAAEMSENEVDPVLKAAVQICEFKAATKNSTVEIECAPGLSARLNPAFLEQAVLNLVDNAIKYCPTGSKVVVRAERRGDHVAISVRDNGAGIDPAHLPRIFERFYRVDRGRSRAEGGTGLGLAIVKHIAQVHGGHATVESELGKGSTFTIFIKASIQGVQAA